MYNTRKYKPKKQNATRKQYGGKLCKGNISRYTPGRLIGKGSSGKVYMIKEDSDIIFKIQPIREKYTEDISKEFIENEIQITKRAGELGVAPKIHDVIYCKSNDIYSIITKSDKVKSVIFIMDRIKGVKTIIQMLDEYVKDLEDEDIDKKYINDLLKKQLDRWFEEIKPLLDILYDNGIIHQDLNGANIVYGYIGNDKPRWWIIDYGVAEMKDTTIPENKRNNINIKNIIRKRSK